MAVERLKEFANNIVALSKQLRVPRRSLYRWRDELDPIEPTREESPPQNARESTLRKEVPPVEAVCWREGAGGGFFSKLPCKKSRLDASGQESLARKASTTNPGSDVAAYW